MPQESSVFQQLREAPIWEEQLPLKRGDYLQHAGVSNTNVYLILEGCLRIYILENDEEQNIRFAYQNNLITALDSFTSGEASPFYIQSLRKSQVLVCSKKTFTEFFSQSPERQTLWISSLHQLINEQLEREVDLLQSSPAKRLARVLKRSPQLFQEVPHKYIANYLRMSPETLSRLLNLD